MVAFLQHPGIAVGVAEIGEARVIGAVRVEAREKAAAPAAVAVLVPDLADGYTVICQFPALLFDVGDYQIQTLQRARRRVGQADAELDGGARPLGCQLDDPEVGCGFVVDVEFEADLVAVETQRPVRIRTGRMTTSSRAFIGCSQWAFSRAPHRFQAPGQHRGE